MQLDMGIMLHTGDMPYDDIIRMAREAEDLGYHGFWLTEESGKEAFSLLAIIARETSRINLCTGIVNFYSRSPTTLAMCARSLHDISDGRFGPFGIGTGGVGFMVRGHGIEIDRPIGRAREAVEIIRGLLTEKRFSYPQGKWFKPHDFRLREGPVDTEIPIWLAALGPMMNEMGGKVADGVISNWLTPETLAIYRGQIAKGAEYAGRDPAEVAISALTMMCVDHNDEGGMFAMRRGLAFYCASEHYHPIADSCGFGDLAREVKRVWETRDFDAATALVTDEMIAKFSINPETAADYFKWMKSENAYPIIYPLPRHSNMVEDHFITMREAAAAANW